MTGGHGVLPPARGRWQQKCLEIGWKEMKRFHPACIVAVGKRWVVQGNGSAFHGKFPELDSIVGFYSSCVNVLDGVGRILWILIFPSGLVRLTIRLLMGVSVRRRDDAGIQP